MPELRQNLITRDWVIISSERANRPSEFKIHKEHIDLPAYSENCPFCPGNEGMVNQEVSRIGSAETWQVRTVPNKFPALSPEGERQRSGTGIFRSMTGVGIHEVVIEHPRHDCTLALMNPNEISRVVTMYRERYTAIRHDPRVEAIIIFRNHGAGAGSSLHHPHSQVAGTPVVPTQIRDRLDEAVRYHDDHGECIFCRTLSEEVDDGRRIIESGPHFVAFQPFAALSPFHTWIFPRRHMSSFDEISDKEILDLSGVLKVVLTRFHYGLNDPDFNYTIRSIPTSLGETESFHWYLTIVPRISPAAGFEIGSGMFINPSLPEESARFLREVRTP